MKALYAGAGLALAAGMLMGGAMRPQLSAGDRPAGPQINESWTAARASGPFSEDAQLSAYAHGVPDYVTGTDARRVAWTDPPRARRSHRRSSDDVTAYAGDEAAIPAAYADATIDAGTEPAPASADVAPTEATGDSSQTSPG